MSSSYAIAQNYNPQSILADAGATVWAFLRALLLAAVVVGCLAAVFAVVVAFWLPIVQIAGCLALVAAFAWATFPRSAVAA